MPTYTLPNGDKTHDQQLYSRVWRELGSVVERLIPGTMLSAFDPDLQFTMKDGPSLTLPAWAVEQLAQHARPVVGGKFKLTRVRTKECVECGVPVHSIGPGRDRRFCADCMVVRVKMKEAKS